MSKENRITVKQTRWTPAEWVEVQRLAKVAKLDPSKFIRMRVLGGCKCTT